MVNKQSKAKSQYYIAVYVDDLSIAAEKLEELISFFKNKYKLEVKGDSKLTYHLGADYFHAPDGTMVSQPKKYVETLKERYIRLFNEEPPEGLKAPRDKNDHLELETSDTLEEVNCYLTMVG